MNALPLQFARFRLDFAAGQRRHTTLGLGQHIRESVA
jgi:hypothetical protein